VYCAAVYGSSSSPDLQLSVRRHLRLNRALPRALDQPLPGTVRGVRRHARPRGRLHGVLSDRELPVPHRAGLRHQRTERVHHRPTVEDHARSQASAGRRPVSRTDSHHHRHHHDTHLHQAAATRHDGNESPQQRRQQQTRHVTASRIIHAIYMCRFLRASAVPADTAESAY